jgi:predicted nuclease of predicted toxin-antitoxin system
MGQRVKFYTDEHVASAVVHGLRQRGVDVLTVVEAGLLGGADEEHLHRALREERVIFTQDADFLRLHSSGSEHAGIAYARQGTTVGDIIRGLMLIHQALNAEDLKNHVEFL